MRAVAILIFDKCLISEEDYTANNSARRLSAYISSRALATTTAASLT